MKGPFLALHARAFSHTTEDIERVKLAIRNVVGDVDISVTKSEGHHGNPIMILEAVVDDDKDISEFFRRLSRSDLERIHDTLGSRIDEGCNLFIRIDKQAAFNGEVRIGANDDIIAVRIRVRAFPARCEVALSTAKDFISAILAHDS